MGNNKINMRIIIMIYFISILVRKKNDTGFVKRTFYERTSCNFKIFNNTNAKEAFIYDSSMMLASRS
ncbi:hypothetical protein C5O10_03405 [Akkermansia muciniphila]|nr:hypothetical protein C5O09_03375 [Akkermansia muciniphila]QHV15939.1 hypothetical protein C5O10_03405 [Akkermansia muciniphila]